MKQLLIITIAACSMCACEFPEEKYDDAFRPYVEETDSVEATEPYNQYP